VVHDIHGELASVVPSPERQGDRIIIDYLATTTDADAAAPSRATPERMGDRSAFEVHSFDLLARFYKKWITGLISRLDPGLALTESC